MEHAYLSEVFPNYNNPPVYKGKNKLDLNLKSYQKLRIVDGVLKPEDRSFSNIYRKFTKDNRWKVLELLLELQKKYDIEHIKDILKTTTYKNDKKWISSLTNGLQNKSEI